MITFSFNGKGITLQKIFWIYNTLFLTMVEDFTAVKKKDLLSDKFNSKLFSSFLYANIVLWKPVNTLTLLSIKYVLL
jgi:hypothetical protein